ncbi:hypothetical protein DE146DRAFT_152215 [Phaeosphaeria sp. MPI-PUGE-AT-0046c]|nr:hypothetical protein DE146DRAFT_152215 [Phaeosphaeria sp. MPI-PUGE-AT-0046c]
MENALSASIQAAHLCLRALLILCVRYVAMEWQSSAGALPAGGCPVSSIVSSALYHSTRQHLRLDQTKAHLPFPCSPLPHLPATPRCRRPSEQQPLAKASASSSAIAVKS